MGLVYGFSRRLRGLVLLFKLVFGRYYYIAIGALEPFHTIAVGGIKPLHDIRICCTATRLWSQGGGSFVRDVEGASNWRAGVTNWFSYRALYRICLRGTCLFFRRLCRFKYRCLGAGHSLQGDRLTKAIQFFCRPFYLRCCSR